jgi:hypothetical protein
MTGVPFRADGLQIIPAGVKRYRCVRYGPSIRWNNVASVASVFISRWDVAVAGQAPGRLSNTLGIAIGRSTYRAYAQLPASRRWRRAFNAGARPRVSNRGTDSLRGSRHNDGLLFRSHMSLPFFFRLWLSVLGFNHPSAGT